MSFWFRVGGHAFDTTRLAAIAIVLAAACEPANGTPPVVAVAQDDTPPFVFADENFSVAVPASAHPCFLHPAEAFRSASCPPGTSALAVPPTIPDGTHLVIASIPAPTGEADLRVTRERGAKPYSFTPRSADEFVRHFVSRHVHTHPDQQITGLSATRVPVHGFTMLKLSVELEDTAPAARHVISYVVPSRGWHYAVTLVATQPGTAGLDELAARVAGTITLEAPPPDAPEGADAPPGSSDAGAVVAVSDADRVIATLRPGFKDCYQRELSRDRTLSGKIVVTTYIAADGAVDAAFPTEDSRPMPAVARCLAAVIRGARFAAPGGTGSTLKIPVTFVQQGKPP